MNKRGSFDRANFSLLHLSCNETRNTNNETRVRLKPTAIDGKQETGSYDATYEITGVGGRANFSLLHLSCNKAQSTKHEQSATGGQADNEERVCLKPTATEQKRIFI